jgi:hypothetical protein
MTPPDSAAAMCNCWRQVRLQCAAEGWYVINAARYNACDVELSPIVMSLWIPCMQSGMWNPYLRLHRGVVVSLLHSRRSLPVIFALSWTCMKRSGRRELQGWTIPHFGG